MQDEVEDEVKTIEPSYHSIFFGDSEPENSNTNDGSYLTYWSMINGHDMSSMLAAVVISLQSVPDKSFKILLITSIFFTKQMIKLTNHDKCYTILDIKDSVKPGSLAISQKYDIVLINRSNRDDDSLVYCLLTQLKQPTALWMNSTKTYCPTELVVCVYKLFGTWDEEFQYTHSQLSASQPSSKGPEWPLVQKLESFVVILHGCKEGFIFCL